jgi:hypothetical protein
MKYNSIFDIIWCYRYVNTYKGHKKLDPPLERGEKREAEIGRTENMVRKQDFM